MGKDGEGWGRMGKDGEEAVSLDFCLSQNFKLYDAVTQKLPARR